MVVLTPPEVELPTEVAERVEVDATHELLGENPVKPLELPSTSRVVGAPKDHGDAPRFAVLAELLRDEATPVVDIDGVGLAAALQRPPEVVGGFPSSLSKVGAGHHQVSRAIVQDRVDIHVPSDAGDAELVNIHLPERVDVVALEPLERLGFLDDSDHEAMPLQDSMHRDRADLNSSPSENGMDP